MLETTTTTVSKEYDIDTIYESNTIYAALCGYAFHEYSSSYTVNGITYNSVSLPSFISLDQTDSTFDTLTIRPIKISDYTNFASNGVITVTRTHNYDSRVLITSSSVETTTSFTLQVVKNCQALEYSVPNDPQLTVFLNKETLTFTPDTSMSYNLGSRLELYDSERTAWTSICNSATITFSGVESSFMSYDSQYVLSFYPTRVEHLGVWPITVLQQDASESVYEVETEIACSEKDSDLSLTYEQETTEWQLVRRVQEGSVWHQATDDLYGNQSYGTPCESTENCSFSITWNQDDFNEFKFETGDGELWMIMTKDEVYAYASPSYKAIESSSISDDQYSALMYQRNSSWYNYFAEDPLLSLRDHETSGTDGSMLYAENSSSSSSTSLTSHNGVNVYVRSNICHSTETTQKIYDKTTRYEFLVRIYIENYFTLDVSDTLYFETDYTETVEIPYSITQQEEAQDHEISFYFRIDDETIIDDWISVDLENELVTLQPPTDLRLQGLHQVTVFCVIEYTDEDVVPYLADQQGLLQGNQAILSSSFYIDVDIPVEVTVRAEGPFFDYGLLDQTKDQGKEWKYTLPSVTDPEDAEFELTYEIYPVIGNSFIKLYEPPTYWAYQFTILDGDLTEISGTFYITISLSVLNSFGIVERQTQQSFTLTIIGPSSEENLVDEDFFISDEPAPQISKAEISQTGELFVQFDQQMKVPNTLPDGQDINLFFISQGYKFKGRFYYQNLDQERRLQSDYQDIENPLAWTLKNMTESQIEFVLNFTEPLEISENQQPDRLQIEFLSETFISQTSGKPLDLAQLSNSALELKIPRQFASKEAQKVVEVVTETTSTFVTVNIVLLIIFQLIGGQIIKKIVPLFLSLQLLFHFMYRFDYPINTTTVFQAIDDAIKAGALKRLIFEQINAKRSEIHKDNQLGFLIIFATIAVGVLILVSFLLSRFKKSKKAQELSKKIQNKIFYETLVNIMIVSSLAFSVQAGFGRTWNFNDERPMQGIPQMIIIFIGLAVALFFPLFSNPLEKYQISQYRTSYGVLYIKYRNQSLSSSLYLFFFFCHRILFALILQTTLPFTLTYQLLLMLQLIWIGYLIKVDPFLHKQDTYLYLVNALFLTLQAYLISAYTFATISAKKRYQVGFCAIGVLIVMIVVNFIWMIVSVVKDRAKQKVLEMMRQERIKKREKKYIEHKYIIQERPEESESESEEESELQISSEVDSWIEIVEYNEDESQNSDIFNRDQTERGNENQLVQEVIDIAQNVGIKTKENDIWPQDPLDLQYGSLEEWHNAFDIIPQENLVEFKMRNQSLIVPTNKVPIAPIQIQESQDDDLSVKGWKQMGRLLDSPSSDQSIKKTERELKSIKSVEDDEYDKLKDLFPMLYKDKPKLQANPLAENFKKLTGQKSQNYRQNKDQKDFKRAGHIQTKRQSQNRDQKSPTQSNSRPIEPETGFVKNKQEVDVPIQEKRNLVEFQRSKDKEATPDELQEVTLQQQKDEIQSKESFMKYRFGQGEKVGELEKIIESYLEDQQDSQQDSFADLDVRSDLDKSDKDFNYVRDQMREEQKQEVRPEIIQIAERMKLQQNKNQLYPKLVQMIENKVNHQQTLLSNQKHDQGPQNQKGYNQNYFENSYEQHDHYQLTDKDTIHKAYLEAHRQQIQPQIAKTQVRQLQKQLDHAQQKISSLEQREAIVQNQSQIVQSASQAMQKLHAQGLIDSTGNPIIQKKKKKKATTKTKFKSPLKQNPVLTAFQQNLRKNFF